MPRIGIHGWLAAALTFIAPAVHAQYVQQGGKIVPNGSGTSEHGSSVAVSADGSTAMEGAPLDNLGAGAVWTPVSGASAPSYTFTPAPGNKFYRVQVQ